MNNEQTIALPSGYQLENYRLETVLGHGGFGITYRAKDGDLQKTVAVKEYLPREVAFRGQDSTVVPLSDSDRETFEWGLERFLDEARTLARFEHPSIVGVRRFVRANGTAYLVMDFCTGESLESVLKRERTLPPDRLETMLASLLDALEVLHAAGVTHRDIKPGNIYLREDGSPILLDFGAARQALAQHSRSVTAMATPGYAAFEQYSTKGKQGPWTDIYGLGATLYRCVTGVKPPDATDRVFEDDIAPATVIARGYYPELLLEEIDAALRVQPGSRPQSISEWQGEIHTPPLVVPVRRVKGHREPLVADRYRILGEHGEIVEDTETGLQWMRCSLGQTWNGQDCIGKARHFSYDEGRQAADLVDGWRLPTIAELNTLTYCSSGHPGRFSNGRQCGGEYTAPTIVNEAFPNAPPSDFWSDTPNEFDTSYSWGVYFGNGLCSYYPRSYSCSIRLVRSS